MSSTEDNNSFNDEVRQINTLKEDFADIRKQLEELRLKIGKRNGNEGVAIQETTVVDETTPVPSGFQQQSALVPKLDLTKISSNNKDLLEKAKIRLLSYSDPKNHSFDKNDLHLLANIVANRHDEVQDFLTRDEKKKIKGVAQSRLQILDKKPKVNESEIGFLKDALRGEYQEYKHRDDVTTFSPVSTDRSISFSPLVTPMSSTRSNSPRSTYSSPSSTPRPDENSEEVDDSQLNNERFIRKTGGKRYCGTKRIDCGKRDSTMKHNRHRTTKRSRTNKKSRTLKKKH